MIDKRLLKNSLIYQEYDTVGDDRIKYWFDMKQKKFLHNIDTFYYSVKFKNDFRRGSYDEGVLRLRKYFDNTISRQIELNPYDSKEIYFNGWESHLQLRPFTYAGYYRYMLSCPDMFDIFIAPVVPPDSEGGFSVTAEIIVQIRSYALWMYGVHKAFEKSFDYIDKMALHYGLEVEYTQENRTDFCFHTNYLQNPDVFFRPDKFYKMRVDRFNGAVYHTAKIGGGEYENDYIALGRRSDKVFVRIYLKSKEVVEMGYKPWFFKVWLFNGLINRYDFYCYEKAYLKHSWKYCDIARLEYYLEYGTDEDMKSKCFDIINEKVKMSRENIRKFADILTPKLTLIINVEYQVMRKHSKSYTLIPYKDNSNKGIHKRIYDFLDNRILIVDYLTHDIFRLCEMDDLSNDSNRSRRKDCAFWARLRQCKFIDCCSKTHYQKLIRTYKRKLNAEYVKQSALKSAVTLGIYLKGDNGDSPLNDFMDMICILNDNDIEMAKHYKTKKLRQFNADDLSQFPEMDLPNRNFIIIDADTGVVSD